MSALTDLLKEATLLAFWAGVAVVAWWVTVSLALFVVKVMKGDVRRALLEWKKNGSPEGDPTLRESVGLAARTDPNTSEGEKQQEGEHE